MGKNKQLNDVLRIPAPGFDKSEIEVQLKNGRFLIVKAESDVDWKTNFERAYRLSDSVNTEKIDVEFENGMLAINLPEKEELSKSININ